MHAIYIGNSSIYLFIGLSHECSPSFRYITASHSFHSYIIIHCDGIDWSYILYACTTTGGPHHNYIAIPATINLNWKTCNSSKSEVCAPGGCTPQREVFDQWLLSDPDSCAYNNGIAEQVCMNRRNQHAHPACTVYIYLWPKRETACMRESLLKPGRGIGRISTHNTWTF